MTESVLRMWVVRQWARVWHIHTESWCHWHERAHQDCCGRWTDECRAAGEAFQDEWEATLEAGRADRLKAIEDLERRLGGDDAA